MGFGFRTKERMRKAGKSIFVPDSIIEKDKIDEFYAEQNILAIEFISNEYHNSINSCNAQIEYEIREIGIASGFFAEFNFVLEQLVLAEIMNFSPSVKWGEKFTYYETDDGNMFNKYFVPIKASGKGFVLKGNYLNIVNQIYKCNNYNATYLYKNDLSKVFSKYIKIHKDLKCEYDMEFEELIPSKCKVLGIHYRGTDFKRNYKDHPVSVSGDDTIEQIQRIHNKYDIIFLATDDECFKERVSNEYGAKLKFFMDVKRSSGDESVAFDKEHGKFLLGREVLRDAYSLSKCDGFICGKSQVSFAVEIAKMASGLKFDDFICIDKGINKNDRPTFYESNYYNKVVKH